MQEAQTYIEWTLPFFAPPAWVFGPVWAALYAGIAVSFGYVFYLVIRGRIPKSVAVPFVLNLIANLAFTPIQFGLQNLFAAAVVIVLVFVTLLWAMKAIYPYAKIITYVQIPYALWVLFAVILQLSITYLNV